jgi:hypothetical protein
VSFPELIFLESLLEILHGKARIAELARVPLGTETFPIYSVALGSTDPAAPTLALVGGVHGQEKIGSQVVLSHLETVAELLQWDSVLQHFLERSRIVFLPIVNPVGMFLLRRSNGNRVDLMRNGPLQGRGRSTFLLGGQRISPFLPWYQGKAGAPMEVESQVLCDFIRKEVFPARVSIALDCHSGYGTVDRLWFPYSYSVGPFPDLAETYALKELLDSTYPNHVYHMEPGAKAYTINGDLWDYLYEEHRSEARGERRFLPLTLEMGSWLWLKKNPVQLFSAMGLFHPGHLHRHKRVLRRHITLLDFLHRSVISPQNWAFLSDAQRAEAQKEAVNHWYNDE